MCLPHVVQHFLPLASVSNVGKAMALAAFVATAPAFQQALCTGGNIADVTAKGQVRYWLCAQTTVSSSDMVMSYEHCTWRYAVVAPLCMLSCWTVRPRSA